MSKSFEVQGVVHSIGETTEYGQNGFTKREFVLKLTGEGENSDYPNYIALELIKDKCALMDQYQIGDEISTMLLQMHTGLFTHSIKALGHMN